MWTFAVILLSLGAARISADGHGGDRQVMEGDAICRIRPDTGSEEEHVQGHILFKSMGDVVEIHVQLEGFDTENEHRMHGLHIHEKGDMGDGCRMAGGHFNPHGKNHGGPDDTDRHVGDFGNIEEDDEGRVQTVIYDRSGLIEFEGEHTIIGKAMVVHEAEDDLGRGSHEDSLTTGHAGGRLGCCIIEEIENPPGGGSVALLGSSLVLVIVAMVMTL